MFPFKIYPKKFFVLWFCSVTWADQKREFHYLCCILAFIQFYRKGHEIKYIIERIFAVWSLFRLQFIELTSIVNSKFLFLIGSGCIIIK